MTFRRMPKYDPSTDGTLACWWTAKNATTASMTKAGGAAPNDGDTLATWNSLAGTARSFVPAAGIASMIYRANLFTDNHGVSRPGVSANPGCMVANVLTGFASLAGLTILLVGYAAGVNSGLNCFLNFQVAASPGVTQAQVGINNPDTGFIGGRRVAGDTFQQINGVPITVPGPFIESGTFAYSTASARIMQNGAEVLIPQPFQAAGATSATDVFEIGIGGTPTGATLFEPINGGLCEILIWANGLSPTTLVGANHYARIGWGIA